VRGVVEVVEVVAVGFVESLFDDVGVGNRRGGVGIDGLLTAEEPVGTFGRVSN
jgi:hypothetical protein